MSLLATLPVVIPMVAGILALLAVSRPRLQQAIGIAGAAALLAVSLVLMVAVSDGSVLVAAMGDWIPPIGIALVVDPLSAAMIAIAAATGLAAAVYALADPRAARTRAWPGLPPLLMFLLCGVCGAFVTGDLFNLYVWFEVMLISSFALLAQGGGKERLAGALRYVGLNLVSTVMMLASVGMLYGLTGTLNLADLHNAAIAADRPGALAAVAMLLLIAFGIKAAVFPLFFWLPAAYPTLPIPVAAVFAGLLTKVGVYAMLRVFPLVLGPEALGDTHILLQESLIWIAALTMLTGVLGAAAQSDMRRILSWHIISQIGYMIMGLALWTTLGVVGAVFYLLHHIIVKANLFLVAGVAERMTGSGELAKTGGLYKQAPWLGVLFLIPALSLAGVPPLSGFWAKYLLVRAGLEIGEYVLVAVALVVGLLTLYSMTKIWLEAFWKPAPETVSVRPLSRRESLAMLGPITVFALMTVVIGLAAEPVFIYAERAGLLLVEPAPYVETVLGAPR